MNKNVKVKARVGLDSVAAALVMRSWWQPSFTVGVAGAYDLRGWMPRFGVTLAVENWNTLRWVEGGEGRGKRGGQGGRWRS